MQTQLSPEIKTRFSFRYSGRCTWVGLNFYPQDDFWRPSGDASLGYAGATAVRNLSDRHEKAKGRVVAITKAIRHLPRETRAKIWADYWAQGHRRPR